MKKLLKVNEVCEYLQCSREYLRRLTRSGKLKPPMKIGRMVRFRPQDLEEFIHGTQKPTKRLGA
jgi:excisionase family DNA binding protein